MRTAVLYRGRFAPSPTGPLHFGSLVAALGSYLQAESLAGEWWLRIEDIDPPREVPGATEQILRTLEAYGFEWHGEVQYQRNRLARYQDALQQLQHSGLLYACECSRRQIAKVTGHTHGPLVYPGTCRSRQLEPRPDRALRLHCHDSTLITFEDAIQGHQRVALAQQGDFVLKRADGLLSYALAVALDDAEQGMTEVVRGCDLLDATARQIYIQTLLALPVPRYAHLPLALDPQNGSKLSKQNLATPLSLSQPTTSLWQGLYFLGQNPPIPLQHSSLSELWRWARANWRLKSVPRTAAITLGAQ